MQKMGFLGHHVSHGPAFPQKKHLHITATCVVSPDLIWFHTSPCEKKTWEKTGGWIIQFSRQKCQLLGWDVLQERWDVVFFGGGRCWEPIAETSKLCPHVLAPRLFGETPFENDSVCSSYRWLSATSACFFVSL